MRDEVQREAEKLAAQNNLLPEEIDVLDFENKEVVHNWSHFGLTHVCNAGTHPRHIFISRA